MTSREKLIKALNHEEAPLAYDLGATKATGINAIKLYKLRRLFGRDEPVKIYDTYQMLGLVDEQDAEMFGIDVLPAWSNYTCFGYKNNEWKPWTTPDGTPALIGSDCAMSSKDGRIFIHPMGDINAPASGCMPGGGFYFDQIVRQEPYDEDDLDGLRDFAEDLAFYRLKDETVRFYEDRVDDLYKNTDKGIVLNAEFCNLGAQTMVFGPCCRRTPGIRNYADWLMAHLLYPEYLEEIYDAWVDTCIENLKLLYEAVGNKPQAVFLCSTDFGTQKCEVISRDMYREFYFPRFKKVNDWVHEHTQWKTLFHCCGSITKIIGDMVEAGVDALNPIQTSAAGMDPVMLKETYGDRLTFWGGIVDCQTTISQGTPDDVEKELRERIAVFGKGGGLVGSVIHNLQYNTPDENILRAFEVLKEYRQ